ncbi:hypothetical protein [Allonocardiopsis opalescens]|uniref:Integral membrane protein n=1 Tax=Allonocardiopsis opalescens TaxID=1144618 RepID=A0A2T0Q4J5_9ACTN|nr:hypothetical protein [Allonocardiopsis opalescens]PRX98683.1 hypothetical protein CLV72_104262 [Allonocardiopsis opalescens]
MIGWYTTALITASLLVAGWSGIQWARGRAMGWSDLGALTVLEVALLAQLVVSVVLTIAGEGPAEPATFWSYLVTLLFFPPAAGWWGLMERSKWGPAVIVAVTLVMSVMVVRLGQVWEGVGG